MATEEMVVLGAVNGEYASKTHLAKILKRNVDPILAKLVSRGLVEAISISGKEPDHFRLTEEGRRILGIKAAGTGRQKKTLEPRSISGDGDNPRGMRASR